MSLLVIGEDLFATHRLPASGELRIGRSVKCGLRIDDASISREHALVRVGPPLTIEDLGSANGTRVREQSLAPGAPAALGAGSVAELGSVMVVVRKTAARPAAEPVVAHDPFEAAEADGSEPVDVVVEDPVMRRLYEMVDRIAPSEINVLIVGETGVGKERVAERIHRRSARAAQPFLRLNCAAFSEPLLESELFGHERGAFTGATQSKPGLLEAARGGTVFLDEIGEMPPSMQAKLLRVLEDPQVMRVGALAPRPIDVRFVAATNSDLGEATRRRAFREDLYFRLNGVTLSVPALRERPAEIEPLARTFLGQAGRHGGRTSLPAISREALALLKSYRWPGNVRELRNVIRRAVLLCGDGPVTLDHLPVETMLESHRERPIDTTPAAARSPSKPPAPPTDLKKQIGAIERDNIVQALERSSGNQTRAAKQLGMPLRTFVSRLETYGIARPRKRSRGQRG